MLFTQHRLSYWATGPETTLPQSVPRRGWTDGVTQQPHPTSSQARRWKHSISSCHTKQQSILPLRRLSGTSWSRAILHWTIFSISAPDILYRGNGNSQLCRYRSIGNTTILFQTNYLVSLGNTCPSHFGPCSVVLMLLNSATSNMISGFTSCVIISFHYIVTRSQSLSISVYIENRTHYVIHCWSWKWSWHFKLPQNKAE